MKTILLKIFLVALGILGLLSPDLLFANGGDQRIAGGYLVNLSRSPFTPIAGTRTALLASFVDIKTGKLIKDDITVSIKIGTGNGSGAFIHEKKDIPVYGGVLEYSYTFQNSGMHEIFFDFTFVNDPARTVHELPDFLLDVQKPGTSEKDTALITILIVITSAIIGGVIGWLIGRKYMNKNLW